MDNKITRHEDIDELIAIVHRNEKRRMVSMILWVTLAFAFGSILTYLVIKEKEIRTLTSKLSYGTTLTKPVYNDTLTKGVHNLEGKILGKIPQNYKVRVFAESSDIYYPMIGEVIISEKGDWKFDNFVIGLTGAVNIVIAAISNDLSKKFDEKMTKGDYRGVPKNELEDLLILASTTIHVRP